MPLYDMVCENCNHQEESFIKKSLNDNVFLECPKCKETTFKKIWSSSGYNSSFGLGSWKKGLSLNEQASALLSPGTLDGKRII